MFDYVMVGIGGGIGAMTRLYFTKVLPTIAFGIPFPILAVNVIGCFVMGIFVELMALYWQPSENLKYFLTIGFLGGFTTFSSFALECGILLERNENYHAALYAVLSFVLSFFAFVIGTKIIRIII